MVACSTCTSVPFSLDLVLATFLLSESLVKTKKNGDAGFAFSALGGGGGGTPLYKPDSMGGPLGGGFWAVLVGAGSPSCRPGSVQLNM